MWKPFEEALAKVPQLHPLKNVIWKSSKQAAAASGGASKALPDINVQFLNYSNPNNHNLTDNRALNLAFNWYLKPFVSIFLVQSEVSQTFQPPSFIDLGRAPFDVLKGLANTRE